MRLGEVIILIARRIKGIRENLKDIDGKWTQKYVAEKIGVARVTYTAYENDTKTPPPDIVSNLADLFNVSTDYILGRTDNPKPADVENEEIDPGLQDFMDNVKVWYKEKPESREETLEIMKKMFELMKGQEFRTTS